VGCDEPLDLVRRLRAAGFDATTRSSLVAVQPTRGPRGPATLASERLLARLVYVPLVPRLAPGARAELVAILRSFGSFALEPAPRPAAAFSPPARS
jgi:hypothetical protein